MFVSPRAVYADVVAHPRIIGALALVLLASIGAQAVFLSTEVGKNALFDQQISTMESFGFTVTQDMYQRLEENQARTPYFSAAGQAFGLNVAALAVAGLILGVFAAMGGLATFRQVYAVVVHSGFILALQQIFVTPLNYAHGALTGASSLVVFFPNLAATGFLVHLLGSIDLFMIWWLVNLAIGVGVVFRRRTSPIATVFLVTYLAIGFAIAIFRVVTAGA